MSLSSPFPPSELRLNLGSGGHELRGLINLDKLNGWSFQDGLDYPDESVQGVTIAHSLMFLPEQEWPALFAEIARTLKQNGIIRITEDSTADTNSERFGGYEDPATLTTPKLVIDHLKRVGIPAREVRVDQGQDLQLRQDFHGGYPKVFYVEGRKPPKVRISVIIPTIGRDTLGAALLSCADADEVIVEFNKDNDHGYSARTRGMQRATGTHIAFLDDDDTYTSNAISLMREAACDSPVIFRMEYVNGSQLWRTQSVSLANVGTPMFLVPNKPELLGEWRAWVGDSCGDYRFISETVNKMGEPVWRPEVVCNVSNLG